MTVETDTQQHSHNGQGQSSLGTAAARNLATTTKTPPQMQGITNRWVQKVLPWVDVKGGVYRVNRRVSYAVRFAQLRIEAGAVVAQEGTPISSVLVVVHGRLLRSARTAYGEQKTTGVIADGGFFGSSGLTDPQAVWNETITAETPCTLLSLDRAQFVAVAEQSGSLQDHLREYAAKAEKPKSRGGEVALAMAAGHSGEQVLPSTFVDYEGSPREYELQVAQTVLRVHSRVADLFNEPMNQIEHQLKLTVAELRERQEHELGNNRDFGLLYNVDYSQRLPPISGPPTPDDLDELLCRRRDSKVFLAHPRAIAAFGRECNKRGLYPAGVALGERTVPAWRGVPILPCPVIPISEHNTSSILVLRTGQDNQGVVGLHQTGIPDEHEPGLNVRFMGIDEKAVISYLVSTYFSAAVLVPDAIGMLENAEIGR
jgi:hypothetical protein